MHPAISINTLCLEPAPLARQAEQIARLGARGITPTIAQLLEAGPALAGRTLRDAGLAVAGLTHMSFGFATPAEAQAARERLDATLEAAVQVGASCVIMTTGGRGALDWQQAASAFADAVAPCAEAARQAGIALGIEPTSHLYADVSIAHRLTDTLALARRGGIAPVIDIFGCWFDADFDEALAQAAPLSPLAQICDYVYGDRSLPCRAVPGDGAIPFERLVPIMAGAGFRGWWDLEIIGPRITAEGADAALPRAAAKIGKLLEEAGIAST